MKNKTNILLFRVATVVAFCMWLSGCANSTRGLVMNTGKRTEFITNFSSATIDNRVLYAEVIGIHIEKGLPALQIDSDVPPSKEIRTPIQKIMEFDLVDAKPNSRHYAVARPASEERCPLTGNSSLEISDIDMLQSEYLAQGTNIVNMMPADVEVCVLQYTSISHHANRYALVEQTASGYDVYLLSATLPSDTRSKSRFWKIPCFLPVTIVWDVVNTVATPFVFVYQYCTADWLPK